MALVDQYINILQNTNNTFQELREIAGNNPILVSVLLDKFPNTSITQLSILSKLHRKLTLQQIQYLLSITQDTTYLEAVRCLDKGDFNMVRSEIQKGFLQNNFPLNMLLLLLNNYFVSNGTIQKSQSFWKLINNNISNPYILSLLQQLSIGKTPQKQELSQITKFMKLIKGDHFQPFLKFDILKLIQTKHSKLIKQNVLIGILKMITQLQNKRIKQKLSSLFLNLLSSTMQNEVSKIPIQLLINIIISSNKQSNTNIQTILKNLVNNKLLTSSNYFSLFSLTQQTIDRFLNLYSNTFNTIQFDIIQRIHQIQKSQHLTKKFIEHIIPSLFKQFSVQQSLKLINTTSLKYLTLLNNKFSIPGQYLKNLDQNQSVFLIFYFNDLQQYGRLINQQIKQLSKSSYTSISKIQQIIKHIQYFVQYDKQTVINGLILNLIRDIYQSDQYVDVEVEFIYQRLENKQKELTKHFEICKKMKGLEKFYHHFFKLLQSSNQIKVQDVMEFLQTIQHYNISQNNINHLMRLHLKYNIPKSNFLKQQYFHQISSSEILVSILQKYQINYSFKTQKIKNKEASSKLIDCLLKSDSYTLIELSKNNWSYYKNLIDHEFTQLYQHCSFPIVQPIQFRGNLFVDLPLVFEHLTPYHDELYFTMYAPYMSLLYCEILTSSPQAINKQQLIKYLFERVKQANQYKKQLDQQYFTYLVWWKIFVFVCYKLLTPQDTQQIRYIFQFLLKDIDNKNLPILLQHIQLLFSKLLSLDHSLMHPLLDKLKKQNSVNVNVPVILSLGLFMMRQKSEHIFQTLISYISSHTAYIRALSQYYCFQYLKQYGSQNQEKFLTNIVRFIQQSKDSKKLMKNIKHGVDMFTQLVQNMNIKNFLTINFQKCQNNVTDEQTFFQLQTTGIKYLQSIVDKVNPSLQLAVRNKIKSINPISFIQAPIFSKYLDLYQKQSQLIIVASLLQKPPNFGHLVRTCSQYSNITLCFPTKNILNEPDYKELVPQSYKCSIIQIKQKDLIKYLVVQKKRNYQLIALEQTSNSVTIDKFQFPKRAVIVLGNERIGMNSSVIQLMDHLVEIQQFGKVRSLNVHVSSVILLWSYNGYKMM